MNTRRFAAAITAATMTLALAACGDKASGSGGDQPYIAIVSKGFQHQFWQAVKKGAEQEAAKEGARITFEGPATEQDIEAQVTMLTNAIAKNPKAIGFAALDSKAAAPLLEDAKAKNIPVIAFDSGVEGDIPVTTASTDITKSILAANPDVAGIYGSNEGSAIGVVKGVEEANKKGVKIVGFDSGKAQIDAIKSGLMAGAITQNPIDIGFYWYDKTNIDEAKIQAVLYQ